MREYCTERNNFVDAERFINYYSANGWKVGKNPMKEWRAAVRSWEQNGYSKPKEMIGPNGIRISEDYDHILDGIL